MSLISSLEQDKWDFFDVLCLFSDTVGSCVYYFVIGVYNLYIFERQLNILILRQTGEQRNEQMSIILSVVPASICPQ